MPGLTEQLQEAINNQSCPSPGINNNLGDWVLLSRVPIPPVSETCDENDTSSFNVNGNLDYSGNVDYTRGDPEFEQISLEELLNQNHIVIGMVQVFLQQTVMNMVYMYAKIIC